MEGSAWDVFGSESDDDETAPVKPSKRPPPTISRPVKPAPHKPRPWKVLLPTFEGVPECGPGSRLINDGASKIAWGADAPRWGVTKMGPDGSDDCVARQVNGQYHASSAEVERGDGGVQGAEGVGHDTKVPFSRPPVFKHQSVRLEASMQHRGGGRGLVASADIAPGTILLVDNRFLPMPTPKDCAQAGSIGQEELCLKWILELPLPRLDAALEELRWLHPQSLDDLLEDEARDLMERCKEPAKLMLSVMDKEALARTGLDVRGVVRLFAVLQSNGFASGIYLHPAMTNHSCRPNAVKWQGTPRKIPASGGNESDRLHDDHTGATRIHTVKADGSEAYSEMRATELIRAGDEITISYLEPREIARPSRQQRLKEQFGFDCNCRLCAAADGEAKPLGAFIEQPRKCEDNRPLELQSQENPSVPGEDVSAAAPTTPATQHSIEGSERHGDDKKHEDADEDEDDIATKGLIAENVLERRLDAVESVVSLTKKGEVRWAGLLSELLRFRRQAARFLACRHISLARADKLISQACIAILEGSLEAAESDPDCVGAVRNTSDGLPNSFGGCSKTKGRSLQGSSDECTVDTADRRQGSFKTRVLAILAAALLSRRMTQLLYLGEWPHPEAGACLADLSQALGMLLAQGVEGTVWINRLPGPDNSDTTHDIEANPKHLLDGESTSLERSSGRTRESGDIGCVMDGTGEVACEASNDGSAWWWGVGGISSVSSFERECDKTARRIGVMFDPSLT